MGNTIMWQDSLIVAALVAYGASAFEAAINASCENRVPFLMQAGSETSSSLLMPCRAACHFACPQCHGAILCIKLRAACNQTPCRGAPSTDRYVQGLGRLSLVLQQFALASGAVGILTFLNAASMHPPVVRLAAMMCIATTGMTLGDPASSLHALTCITTACFHLRPAMLIVWLPDAM